MTWTNIIDYWRRKHKGIEQPEEHYRKLEKLKKKEHQLKLKGDWIGFKKDIQIG